MVNTPTHHIDIATVVLNEEYFLPYFLRHYETFASRILVYDNGSTDATLDILHAHPLVEVRTYPFEMSGAYDEQRRRDFFHIVYDDSPATWIMFPDVDELICTVDRQPASLLARLDSAQHPVLSTRGYQMISETTPTDATQLYELVRTGLASKAYSKPIVARTGQGIRWKEGRHSLVRSLAGHLPMKEDVSLLLLHYRFLGLEYTLARTKRILQGYVRAAELQNTQAYDYKRNRVIDDAFIEEFLEQETIKYHATLRRASDVFIQKP